MIQRFMYMIDEVKWALTIAEIAGFCLTEDEKEGLLSSPVRQKLSVAITGVRSTGEKDPAPELSITDDDGNTVGIESLKVELSVAVGQCIQHFKGITLEDRDMPLFVTEIYEIVNWQALTK